MVVEVEVTVEVGVEVLAGVGVGLTQTLPALNPPPGQVGVEVGVCVGAWVIVAVAVAVRVAVAVGTGATPSHLSLSSFGLQSCVPNAIFSLPLKVFSFVGEQVTTSVQVLPGANSPEQVDFASSAPNGGWGSGAAPMMSALSVSVLGFVTVIVTVPVWPTGTFPKSAGSGLNVSFGQPFLGFANADEAQSTQSERSQ